MDNLFLALILISLVGLVYGLIKPSAFSRIIKGEITRGKIGLIFGGAFIVFFVLFGITADPTEKEASEVEPATQQEEALEKEETQLEPTQEPEPQPEPEATMGEKNALKKALDYLNYTGFSRDGLITQLEYEGFTRQQAVYGADNSGADWNKQATLKAKDYLDYTSFSRSGLIEQLEYEGFTRAQAEYGVEAVGY